MNKVTLYTDELDAIDNQIRDYIERIVNGDEPTSFNVISTDLLNDTILQTNH